jgi:endonuclease/exonuclease/phosphatase (EEP) superfamily protein YafD
VNFQKLTSAASYILAIAFAAIAVIAGLSAILGGLLPELSIAGAFSRYAAILGAIAAAILFRRANWIAATTAATAAAINFALIIPTLFGATLDLPQGRGMTLLAFNMWWSNDEHAAVKEMIAKADPDVLVLMEMTKENRNALRDLDPQYPYRVECWQSSPCDVLIMSRKQLIDGVAMNRWQDVHIGIARAGIDLDNCPVTIFASHLARPWPYQQWRYRKEQPQQSAALADAIAGWPGPKIVVGDFNATPWTYVVRRIAEAAKGHALGGIDGTWPWFVPGFLRLPIDHIVVTSPALKGARQVLNAPGSDHHAVLARLTVANMEKCRP